MMMLVAAAFLGQITVTDVRKNTEEVPINLTLRCSLLGESQTAHTFDVQFSGSAGAGAGVGADLLTSPDSKFELDGDAVQVSLNRADDFSLYQIFNGFSARFDGKKFRASVMVKYRNLGAMPPKFDNSIPIDSSSVELIDRKHFSRVRGGPMDGWYIHNGKSRAVFMRGSCVLRDINSGDAS